MTACGASSPLGNLEPCSPSSPLLLMCAAPATAQQSFFRRVVFFERPFRAYEARCPDRSSPYVLPRGKHAVVTFEVLQSVATLLVHAVLWHLQWMSGAFLLPSFGQDLVASRARALCSTSPNALGTPKQVRKARIGMLMSDSWFEPCAAQQRGLRLAAEAMPTFPRGPTPP